MDYWLWDRHAVFVCNDHLAWFDSRGRVLGPGGRIIDQPFDDYLTRGPWVDGVPTRVAEELAAAVNARRGGATPPPVPAEPHPYRPTAGSQIEWDYTGPYGVRFEGDHLLWYERERDVRFASGGASEQTLAHFLKNGPDMQNVPARVAAEVAAAVVARVAAAGGMP